MKQKKKPTSFQGGPANLAIIVFVVIASLALLVKLTDYTRNMKTLSTSSFIKRVEQGDVKQVEVSGNNVQGVLRDGSPFVSSVGNDASTWEPLLLQHNVDYAIFGGSSGINLWYLFMLASLAIAALGVWFVSRQQRNNSGGGNLFNLGKSKARMFMPSTIKETFASVAGAAEAKEELQDVVDFLKNPEKYRRLGAKMTRGVLLVGEPGNGKTLLARAVAGEANCPFFSISGSDFIEVFVGVGAARVRDLFAQARKHSPSIVFIDEIDAVGRHRGTGMGGGHDEREQTLNQLLTEMDGFQTTGGTVIVLAATNRPDVLDKALLRPGRFDKQVTVPFPDLISREQILRLHAKGVKIDPSVDLHKIARGTPGFSGADLANLINEATIIASKNNQETVTPNDFEEARDKILMGKEIKTRIMSDKERRITAYHEAGHTLVTVLSPENAEPLHKVTILPRGKALGVTFSLPEGEKLSESKEDMLTQIRIFMGGRAAEQLIFNAVTTGAYSDFSAATNIARRMVCLSGMADDIGPVVYKQGYDVFKYSEKTAERIDEAVRTILTTCHDEAYAMLEKNHPKLDLLATTLLERETMQAEEVYELLGIEPRTQHRFT